MLSEKSAGKRRALEQPDDSHESMQATVESFSSPDDHIPLTLTLPDSNSNYTAPHNDASPSTSKPVKRQRLRKKVRDSGVGMIDETKPGACCASVRHLFGVVV